MPTIKEMMTLEEYTKRVRELMLKRCERALVNRLMQISEDTLKESYEEGLSPEATDTGIRMGLI